MRAALVIMFGRGIMALSTMAIVVLIARFCSKDLTASYQLAFSAALLITLIGQGGMPNATMRYISIAINASNSVGYRKVAFAAVLWSTFLSFVCVGLSAIVQYNFGLGSKYEQVFSCAVLIAVWAALLALQVVTSELFRAHHRQIEATLFGGVVSQMLTLLFAFVYLSQMEIPSLKGLVLLSTLPTALSIVVAVYVMAKRGYVRTFPLTPVLKESRPLFLSGARMVGVGIMAYCILQSNVWIVAAIGTADELALFSVANRLVSALSIISVIVSGAYLPSISKLIVAKSSEDLEVLVSKVAFISSGVALCVLASIEIFAEQIISVLFGDAYLASSEFLRILAVGFFLTSMTGLRSQILMVSGYEGLQLRITAASAFLYVVIVYSVGVFFGLISAVWAGTVLFGVIGGAEAYALYKKVGVVSLPIIYVRRVYGR